MTRALAIASSLGAALAAGCSSPSAQATGTASFGAEDCESCHAQIAAEWQHSRHAVAFTNELFQREFSVRRTAWCVTCHAPGVADPANVRDDDPAAQRGVDCLACHQRAGQLVARTRAPNSPHLTRVDPRFGSPSYCGSCHEFSFPRLDETGMHAADTDVAMQETVSQFSATPAAKRGQECKSCHQSSPAGHAFPGSHDAGMLRGAVALRICPGDTEIAIGVQNRGAAHNVPTGGVHRHMVLRAWRSTAPESMFEAYIGRRFEPLADGGKQKTFDSTIAPQTTSWWTVDPSSLGGAAHEPIRVELRYVYVQERSGPVDEIERLSRVIRSERIEVTERPRRSDCCTPRRAGAGRGPGRDCPASARDGAESSRPRLDRRRVDRSAR